MNKENEPQESEVKLSISGRLRTSLNPSNWKIDQL